MAKLFLKGINKPFTISTESAITINKIVEDNSIPKDKQFNKNGLRFSKADIRYIIENDAEDNQAEASEVKKNENDEYYSNMSKEYVSEIKRLCNLSVEEKTNYTKLYELVWSGYTLKPITQEYLEEVKNRQRAFFEKYPKYPYASINVKDLIPLDTAQEYSIKELMPSFSVSKIHNTLSEAFRTAKYIGII